MKYPRTQRPKHPRDCDVRGAFGARGEDEFWGYESLEGALRDGVSLAKPYDLEERTAQFGEAIIRFAKRIPETPVTIRLISQLVGAGTSVGANYCEADDGVSRKDYKNRIGTCKKEARETKHFLRMVAVAVESLKPDARVLWLEARELHLIFCSIFAKQKTEDE